MRRVKEGIIGILCLLPGLLAVATPAGGNSLGAASSRGPVLSDGKSAGATAAPAAAMSVDPPETVLVTYRPTPGKEELIRDLIQRHWEIIRRLGLVTGESHQLYRAADAAGHTYFIDILTWKSHEAPDTAPAEVQAIWKEMQAAVEHNPGVGGIDIVEIHPVKSGK